MSQSIRIGNNTGGYVMLKQKWSIRFKIFAIIVSGVFLIAANSGNNSQKTNSKNEVPAHSKQYHVVDIKNMVFSPAKLSISPGDTVVWTNSDNVPHMVNATNSGQFQSPLFNQGQNYQHIFPQVGKYDYRCGIHPTMTGSITVKQ
jgi:plastocyanin